MSLEPSDPAIERNEVKEKPSVLEHPTGLSCTTFFQIEKIFSPFTETCICRPLLTVWRPYMFWRTTWMLIYSWERGSNLLYLASCVSKTLIGAMTYLGESNLPLRNGMTEWPIFSPGRYSERPSPVSLMAFGDNLVQSFWQNYGTDYCLTRTVGNLLQIWGRYSPMFSANWLCGHLYIKCLSVPEFFCQTNPIFTYCRRIK